MESANLQHQLQDQRGSSTSSLAAAPSCYGFGNNNHFWTSSSTTTNNTTFIGNSNPNYNGRQKSDNLVSPLNSSMVQDHDLGFHWNSDNAGADQSFSSHQSAHELQLAKIKEEQCFPKFTELLNSPSNMDDYYFLPQIIKNEHKDLNHELSEKLLLKTLSSSCQINGHQISTGDFLSNNNNNNNNNGVQVGRGHFSQIYPSINISNLNQSSSSSSTTTAMSSSSSSSSSSLDMSLRALDHLTSAATFSGNLNDNLGVGGVNSSFGLDQMQQPHNTLSCAAHRKVISSFNNEAIEAKRPGSSMEAKGSTQAAQKKSRLESRTPCPPFKVRKEKLGDRIAALQQLVAPFGKTDTASVLMEAIGYIKFLQNQVETLSVPYMKSAARNKSYKTMQGGPKENGNGEAKRDLRSRGLCLVPLSCMSYVTGDGGGGSVWPPPNFGGET